MLQHTGCWGRATYHAPMRFKDNKRGFTLIELVVVITIMGLLAAFAIPRFVDLAGSAREAALDSMVGSARSAAALAHAASLTGGIAANDPIQMEGLAITMFNRYPDAPGMVDAANLSLGDDFQIQTFGNVAFIIWATGTPGWGSCGFAHVRAIPPFFPLPRYFGPNVGGC